MEQETILMMQVPPSSPLMLAWAVYKATDEYRNKRQWALQEAHVDGALWDVFVQGYQSAFVSDSLMLTERDRHRFASYLEKSAASDQAIAAQAEKLGPHGSEIARRNKIRAAAYLIVARDLRSIHEETIGNKEETIGNKRSC